MIIEDILFKILFTQKFEFKIIKIYKKLKEQKKIDLIHKLKRDLSLIRYEKKIISTNNLFENNGIDIGLSINQYVYSKFINKIFFNTLLMIAISDNKSFFYPLPKIYLDQISKVVKVNYALSNLLFLICLSMFFIINILKIFLSFIYYFKFDKIKYNLVYSNSHPPVSNNLKSSLNVDNFYSFIINKFEIKNNVVFLHKNKNLKNFKIQTLNKIVECLYINDPVKPFLNIFNFYNFFKSFYFTVNFFIKCLVCNKFEMLFMLYEVFNYYQYNLSKKKYSLCLFNQSDATFRPLWSYLNSKEEVFLYFYSINLIPPYMEIKDQKYYETRGFCLQSWNSYLTWNKKHEEFLDQNTKQEKKYLRVDYVPYDGEQKILNKQKKIISIFDIPPKKEFIYSSLSNPYNIYTLDYCINFIKNIISEIEKFDSSNYEIIIKIKRINHYTDKTYVDYLNKISLKNGIKILYDISAQSLIDSSDMVISIPFTSTSTIAHKKGKKTIYYDPSGKVETAVHSLSENIQIINSKDNLNNWLKNNL